MALVVFLRGMNVGGHRRFRPSVLARELCGYGAINIGGAGTFVVRDPGSLKMFRAELLRRLPFHTEAMFCNGRDIIRLVTENPYKNEPTESNAVRFVSILSRTSRRITQIPFTIPPSGQWFVRVIAVRKRFVLGEYRHHMKTITYLGQLDKFFGTPVTTRNWNTVLAVMRILKASRTRLAE